MVKGCLRSQESTDTSPVLRELEVFRTISLSSPSEQSYLATACLDSDNAYGGNGVTVHSESLIVINNPQRFAKVIVYNLLTSSLLSPSGRRGFLTQLRLSATT